MEPAPSGPYEIHTTDIKEHEIVVCGILLKETKKITKINIDNGPTIKEILVHNRSIGNREVEVTNFTANGRLLDVIVDTTFYLGDNRFGQSRAMSEDEINQFRRDWGKLWIPVRDDEMEYKVKNSKEVVPPSPAFAEQMGGIEMGGSRMDGSRMAGSRMDGSRMGGSKMGGSRMGGSRMAGSRGQGSRMVNNGGSNMAASGMPMKLPGQ